MTQPQQERRTLAIRRDGDDRFVVRLDGEEVGVALHDDIGWSGMEVVEGLVKAIAKKAGWRFEDTQEADAEEE